MKTGKISFFALLSLTLLLLTGCRQTPVFTVTGEVAGGGQNTIYLEHVGLSTVTVLDSAKLSSTGTFHFKQEQPEYPDFFRLRLNGQLINFAIDSSETITITADEGTFAISYKIEGSENCIAIKEITLAQLDAVQSISKARREYETGMIGDTTYQSAIILAVENYKDVAKKHIYSNPMSTASYFALFQQIEGLLFFDLYDKEDARAYGAVATSFNHFYPESLRAKHLYNLALQSLKVIRQRKPLDMNSASVKEVNLLDIALSNINGEKIKLSDVAKSKVVILNFTAYQTEWAFELNIALDNLYQRYHAKGLEIYQISLDNDLHLWKNTASNFPWVCVRDPETYHSAIAAMYNVKQLPTFFILDRKGAIIKRVEEINQLEEAIQPLL